MRPLQALVLLSAGLVPACSAFYIPGWSIRSYKDADPIPLHTNKLTSPVTQLPYAYADLPFVCPASKDGFGAKFGSRAIGLNLGEVLRGDRIHISDYELVMGQDIQCKHLCDQVVDRNAVQRAKDLIRGGYVVEWIVDNLPGATSFVTVDKTKKYYASGFKLGNWENNKAYINNHVTLVLRWRKMAEHPDRKVIVAFEVYTKSIDGPLGGKCPESLDDPKPLEINIPTKTDEDGHPVELDDGKTMTIPYTYSVYWKEDNSIDWANRWDLYFVNDEESASVHWLAIINSLVIAMLLSIMVAIVMLRTLSRDIQNYNETGPSNDPEGKKRAQQEGDDDESLEDITGWKLVHGDVFRPPAAGGLFAPLVGSGVQLMAVLLALIVLSIVGVLNPSYRGGFISFALFLFVFAGVFSGYFSTRVYKTFKGENWKKNALMTALIFPGFVFSTVFILNLFVWAQASSTAIPFSTLLALVFMWLGISLPLVFVGAHFGFKKAAWEHPTRTTLIPRQIPTQQPWYLRTVPSILLGGLIPFAVIFIELLFVFKSLWQDKSTYYYMYGFLGMSVLVLVVTVVEITIVMTYFLLCAENYRWWWRSFLVGGGSAVWIFLYSVWYFCTKLQVQGFVSGLLFFAYSALACTVYGVLVGTVGFLSSYAFVRRIYGAIKAD